MAINCEQDFISVTGFTKYSNIDFNMFHIKTKSLILICHLGCTDN